MTQSKVLNIGDLISAKALPTKNGKSITFYIKILIFIR